MRKHYLKNKINAATANCSKITIPTYYKNNKLALGITILFTIILFINLFIPPLGTKTSTDFGRIMDLFHLYYQPGEMNWGSFHSIFNFDRLLYNAPSYNGYIATTSIFIFVSFIPNFILRFFIANSDGLYYIVCLGFVYMLCYIFAFYVLIELLWQRLSNKKWLFIIVAIFSIWAFNDILFIEYFNSFFQEPAFIVTMFLFIVCFLRFKSFLLDIILFSLILFSKEQNMVFAMLIIPIYIKHHITISKVVTTAILIGSICYVYTNINTYALHMNNENGVLSGLLHKTTESEARQMLAKMGLDPELSVLRDRDYWGNIGYINQNPYDLNARQQFINAEQITRKYTLIGYINYPYRFITNYIEYIKINHTGPFTANYSYNDQGQLEKGYFAYFSKLFFNRIELLLLINLFVVIYAIAARFYIKLRLTNTSNELALLFFLNLNLLFIIPTNFVADGYAEPIKHCFELFFTETINIFLIIYHISAKVKSTYVRKH